jgi:CRISPR-associated protein Csb3
MTYLDPTIRINVDAANPGEFFACCGIFELADRLWQDAEAWFSRESFCVSTRGTLPAILNALTAQPPDELTRVDKLDVKKLIAPLRLHLDAGSVAGLTLDAWLQVKVDKGEVRAAANPPWNFWSGQQTSLRIWSTLREALTVQLESLDPASYECLFGHRVLLSGRFGFDPGAAWNALDVGFSPNEQKIGVASSPAVELLAAVGLQRFRPKLSGNRITFEYTTWGQPVMPAIAAAAAAGAYQIRPLMRFLGRVVGRGSYAALGYSTPLGEDSNE